MIAAAEAQVIVDVVVLAKAQVVADVVVVFEGKSC